MRVITFSRFFPAYHPRKGEPTYFVEKIWKYLYDNTSFNTMARYEREYSDAFPCMYVKEENIHNHEPKNHTIRSGNRWKVGDKFSPRVWSGKPYRSKQITIAPDIEIKKIWNISFDEFAVPAINGTHLFDEYNSQNWDFDLLAKNDGLTPSDAIAWFKPYKETVGQIICWNNNLNLLNT